MGHDVGGGGGRSAGHQHADPQILTPHPEGDQDRRGHQGKPDDLDAGGESGHHQVASEFFQGEGTADGHQRQGERHSGGDMQGAVEYRRHGQAEKTPEYPGEGSEDERIEEHLPGPEPFACLGAVVAMGEEQGEDGEEVEHRDEKSHEDAGPGESLVAIGVEDDGKPHVGEVAAEGSLAEDAPGCGGITAQGGVAVGEGEGDGDGRCRAEDQGAVEAREEVGASDLVKEEEGEGDVVDQAVGLKKKGGVDQGQPFQKIAEGDDEKNRENDSQNFEEQGHGISVRGIAA